MYRMQTMHASLAVVTTEREHRHMTGAIVMDDGTVK